MLVVVLASCASESSDDTGAGTNPPTLWLAMATGGSQMQLVPEEPRPY